MFAFADEEVIGFFTQEFPEMLGVARCAGVPGPRGAGRRDRRTRHQDFQLEGVRTFGNGVLVRTYGRKR